MNKEIHPLKPFLPQGCKLLMCGTFPPGQNRWSMQFYYPNYINDMWRIFGLIFLGDKDALTLPAQKMFKKQEIIKLLSDKKIGLSDTGKEVERIKGNASDKFLEIKKPIDLPGTFALIPECVALATTGEKAASIVAGLTGTALPGMGGRVECAIEDASGNRRMFYHYRMPSSSRAYPMKLEKKAEYYAAMFTQLGIF